MVQDHLFLSLNLSYYKSLPILGGTISMQARKQARGTKAGWKAYVPRGFLLTKSGPFPLISASSISNVVKSTPKEFS